MIQQQLTFWPRSIQLSPNRIEEVNKAVDVPLAMGWRVSLGIPQVGEIEEPPTAEYDVMQSPVVGSRLRDDERRREALYQMHKYHLTTIPTLTKEKPRGGPP